MLRSVRRLLTGAVLASALTASTALPAGAANGGNPNPPPDPYHAGTVVSDLNLYVAAGGYAEIPFSAEFKAALKKAGVTVKQIHPFKPLPGKSPNDGLWLPVGNRYDAIQLDTRFTYPGGFVLTNKAGRTWSANGWSLLIEPVVAGFYVNPWVGKQQLGKNFKVVDASFVEALTTGGFFAPHFEGGQFSWGPTKVALRITAKMADVLKKHLGVVVAKGTVLGHITVRWSDRPMWQNEDDIEMGKQTAPPVISFN
ncbi:hypothetical protein P8605_31210 [Streptomyces sp. T-3]|nr:hypothetical protein [Streptomyces sp. T-3]